MYWLYATVTLLGRKEEGGGAQTPAAFGTCTGRTDTPGVEQQKVQVMGCSCTRQHQEEVTMMGHKAGCSALTKLRPCTAENTVSCTDIHHAAPLALTGQ